VRFSLAIRLSFFDRWIFWPRSTGMQFESWLRDLGWTPERQRQLEALGDATLLAARVGVEHRGAYGLLGAPVESAQLAGRFRHGGGEGQTIWPAVGDWVAVQAAGGRGLIQHVLPRATVLSRRRPMLVEPQVVAANVDVVFIVTAAGGDLSPRRIERYLAGVWVGGARPVVVLNKADLDPDLPTTLAELETVSAGVTSLATSAASGQGLEELRALIPRGGTVVLVGSSGVGKSSLLNRLLGEERQLTREVRLTDETGRHTTTRRELLELPGAGWLIDTPGMRQFALWDAEEGVGEVFEDIEELARSCRFRDCTHRSEPGCAVAEAIEQGSLSAERLASFEKLRREDAYLQRKRDRSSRNSAKRRWKTIHKDQRARQKVDPKLQED
jgi:ribosome biogenesis GTPase / thiamine phosphate phosphatase